MVQKVRSRGKKVAVPPEDRDRIVSLNREGKGYTKISQETGYSRWTIALVLKEAGLGPAVPSKNGKAAVRTMPKPAEKEAAAQRPAEVKKEPEKRVTTRRETGRVPTAAELTLQIAAAEQEARKYARQITEYADEMAKLWERAEYLSSFEGALAEAIAAVRVMKERADRYKRQLDEIQQQSLQKSMAIHSESKNLTRE